MLHVVIEIQVLNGGECSVTPPSLLVMTAPAAVDLFENTIVPGLFPKVSATVMKVWLTPELFVMPANGKREARPGGNGEGVKARVRVEHDPVDLGVG